jgi:hypothetical protein
MSFSTSRASATRVGSLEIGFAAASSALRNLPAVAVELCVSGEDEAALAAGALACCEVAHG